MRFQWIKILFCSSLLAISGGIPEISFEPVENGTGKCGGYDLKFRIQLKKISPQPVLIVQEYDKIEERFDCSTGKPDKLQKRYYEAWSIRPGQIHPEGSSPTGDSENYFDDNIFRADSRGTRGNIMITLKRKVFLNRSLPESFQIFHPDTTAGEVPSQLQEPDFWKAAPVHSKKVIRSRWDCCP